MRRNLPDAGVYAAAKEHVHWLAFDLLNKPGGLNEADLTAFAREVEEIYLNAAKLRRALRGKEIDAEQLAASEPTPAVDALKAYRQ